MENNDNVELILINISGEDHPGVTASLTGVLARYDATILDIGQADIHHNLSLGILVKTSADVSGAILKSLLLKLLFHHRHEYTFLGRALETVYGGIPKGSQA